MITLSVIALGVGGALAIIALNDAICWLAERAALKEVGDE